MFARLEHYDGVREPPQPCELRGRLSQDAPSARLSRTPNRIEHITMMVAHPREVGAWLAWCCMQGECGAVRSCAGCVGACFKVDPGRAIMAKKALLIGINYVDSPYKLKGCHNDVGALRDLAIARFAHYAADSLKSVITEKFGFPAANVKILRDSGKPGEEMPTKANIMAAVSWLAEGAKPGDRLMMHFSGHGGQVKDEDGDEEDGYDGTSSFISLGFCLIGHSRGPDPLRLDHQWLPH